MYEVKEQAFDILYEKILKEMNIILNKQKENLNLLKSSFIFKNPNILVIDKVYSYNDLIKKLKYNLDKVLTNKTNDYLKLLNKIEVLNPITTIKRGYSIVKVNNKVVTSVKDVKKGDIITNQLIDGNIQIEVI